MIGLKRYIYNDRYQSTVLVVPTTTLHFVSNATKYLIIEHLSQKSFESMYYLNTLYNEYSTRLAF